MVKAFINDFAENTYIINKNKDAFVIDPGSNFKELEEYIKTKELNINGILLTHGHFDHIVSLNDFVETYKCKVYIHEKERDFLFDPNLNLSGTTYQKMVVKNKECIETFDETFKLKLGYDNITVLHTPGHTRGSVCYKYKGYLFSGDTLFKGTVGRTDLPTSSKGDLHQSLKKIVSKCSDNTIIYPGHGHFSTLLNEKYENPFLNN